jgi:predicted RND superfamily exporter protein
MVAFTSIVFFQNNRVLSRTLLGFNAVLSILLSILTGFGILFICHVPMTSLTSILPFIMFGIGLDDSFIILGAFLRTNESKGPVERMIETIDEIGLSITLTSLTSVLAFALGSMSSVPVVYWLCQYAYPTIFITYLYQITFFTASVVLDERRIAQNRQDCCSCIKVPRSSSKSLTIRKNLHYQAYTDRFMNTYAEFLLRPLVKAVVVVSFTTLFFASCYSTSQLTQNFKYSDALPDDSYITDFQVAYGAYTGRGLVYPTVYFRGVDQGNIEIQNQMIQYMSDLAGVDAIGDCQTAFWLTDFHSFVENSTLVQDLSFFEQVDTFLTNPVFQSLYAKSIVRDEKGNITTSRATICMNNIDVEDVSQQIAALKDQEAVTNSQPINNQKGHRNDEFFTYDNLYNVWTFYSVSINELIMSTLSGVVSVTAVALFLIPHYTAFLFVLPMIIILYVDLLGFLQWVGIYINPISYITLVVSIGLMVDFVIHVLLRFYESPGNRHEKTVDVLRTLGSSMLSGGISTFLGCLPLAFSKSVIFMTIFWAFLGLVILGCMHGLVLMPVILATIGPEECIRMPLSTPVAPKPELSVNDVQDCTNLSISDQEKE